MSYTLDVSSVYEEGATVAAYPYGSQPTTGRAVGTAVASSMVVSGSVTLTGLTEDAAYTLVDTESPYTQTSFIVNQEAASLLLNGVEVATAESLSDAIDAAKAGALGVVIHGDVDDVARPEGYGSVQWIGSVAPLNSEDYDLWTDTSA